MLTPLDVMHVAPATLGQPVDTIEFQLFIAFLFGFLPALVSYIIGCAFRGGRYARTRAGWLLGLGGFILLSPYLESEGFGILDIGVSWILAVFFLVVPARPKARGRGQSQEESGAVDEQATAERGEGE